jgi:HAD superfamily hydrolase (TIGR01509 family)
MAALRAALLDIDGTLVDSNDAHARAWQRALEHFGHSIAFETLRSLIGKGGDHLLAETAGIDVDSSLGRQIAEFRGQVFMRDYLPQLKPFPKARELLLRLRDEQLRLVVATSAKRSEMDALLEICGARYLMYACTSSDDADHSKPDPDIIQAALHKGDAAASESLLLGDTPYDLEAAKRAGVNSIAVRSGGWGDVDLKTALVVYNDVADLLLHYAQSPFAWRRG